MVGDDPVNDVRGAELGIRTVLVRPGGASLADLVLWLVRARTTRARYPLQMGGIEPSIARET
jgi:ribonucleotide monophosphatase NagD (HAD superfamily)